MASLWVEDLGGNRFKVRWRELVPGLDGRPERGEDGRLKRRLRSLTVEGKDARDEAMARIRRALVEEGEYQSPAASPIPEVANAEQAAVAWIAYKATRCSRASVARYAQHMRRFFEAVRKVRSLGENKVVPFSILSRDLLVAVVRSWQVAGLSESFVYGCSRSALEMWRWASDDPATFPGVPTPPREAKAALPPPPLYVAPPAPTLSECDAALRHLPLDARETRRIGTFLRYTGLRIFQVVRIRRQDLDFEEGTLTVTTGKSRAEKAEMRTIPVARALLSEIQEWAEPLPPGELLFPVWGKRGDERPASIRPEVFGRAWAEAVKAGEAREVAWKPVNRKTCRPEHAFRAAFQARLRLAGVAEPVIDVLVGHHGKTIRARHYAGAESVFPQMRAAVDALPPIAWAWPMDRGSVISLAKRKVTK